MTWLSERLDYVGTRQQALAGQACQYRRGESAAVFDVVPLGQRRNELSIGNVLVEQTTEQDFAFDACDLVLDGKLTTPQRGDLLCVAGATFEVVPAADQVFSYVTSSRKRIRVHTRAR